MTIKEIFDSMDYGTAPESASEAMAWIAEHGARFGLFIDGAWTKPGDTFETKNPATGEVLAKITQAGADDVDAAVRAARKAQPGWAKLSGHQRARKLYALARLVQKHARLFAVLETLDNGKPIRESRDIDIPLVARHFYYHAGMAQLQDAELADREALGVAGQIIPWNFPLLMLAWKIAPAIAMGNTVVLKPAEYTSLTALLFAQICDEAGLPKGVVNIVTGDGAVGEAITAHEGIDKIAFTGSTQTGRMIMQYATENLIPVTLELGGKSPNIFFSDVMARDDAFLDKAVEGFVLFAFNQGEVCTCPSRALIQESIYESFMERAVKRVQAIKQGHPLDPTTMIGAQASSEQLEKILSYMDIGRQEGAEVLAGGGRAELGGDIANGYYVQPTVFKGHNKMRIFQEEIFGPVVSVTTFKTQEEALAIANDTLYGLGAGVWSRDMNTCYRMGRAIQAGRVWTNCYHQYPAHAAFGGYKQSGIGRENHKMMLGHYQQTKNLLVSYSPKALGFF